MVRVSQWLMPMVAAVGLLTANANGVHAQYVYYQPAPVVSYYAPPVASYYAPAPVASYYAPAPVVSYYAPVASYYAPAPVASYYYAPSAVTTYRYGMFGRVRAVNSYYGAPVVSRYGYYYP